MKFKISSPVPLLPLLVLLPLPPRPLFLLCPKHSQMQCWECCICLHTMKKLRNNR